MMDLCLYLYKQIIINKNLVESRQAQRIPFQLFIWAWRIFSSAVEKYILGKFCTCAAADLATQRGPEYDFPTQ